MKKVFWYLYTRLRLWYIYRGENIPYNEGPNEYNCPTCYWTPPEDDYSDLVFLGSYSHYYGHDGYHSCTEKWQCPRCGTVFEFDTSN